MRGPTLRALDARASYFASTRRDHALSIVISGLMPSSLKCCSNTATAIESPPLRVLRACGTIWILGHPPLILCATIAKDFTFRVVVERKCCAHQVLLLPDNKNWLHGHILCGRGTRPTLARNVWRALCVLCCIPVQLCVARGFSFLRRRCYALARQVAQLHDNRFCLRALFFLLMLTRTSMGERKMLGSINCLVGSVNCLAASNVESVNCY